METNDIFPLARIAIFCFKKINIIVWHPQGWSTLPPAPAAAAAAPPEASSGTLCSQDVQSQLFTCCKPIVINFRLKFR